MAANGIFCLEGEWDTDLRKRGSVLPLLQALERLKFLKFIHRDVATAHEVERYLTTWQQARYDDYRVLFLASHGDKGRLLWSRGEETSLADLAEHLQIRAAGAHVYLGSCLTMFNVAEAEDFVRRTEAASLSGYRREVGWLEGASIELVWLASLAGSQGKRPRTLFNELMNQHGPLAKLYKFTLVTKNELLQARRWEPRV